MTDAHTLIVFAHPYPRRSRVNRHLLEAVAELPGVTVHDLYERYPEFDVDVAYEQQALLAHQRIVFQHPMYWYNAPPLLKEWLDSVLERGFAYGPEGDKLHGKQLLHVISTGGPEDAYREGAYHGHEIDCFLYPWRQTARFCGMHYLDPLIVHHAARIDREALEAAARRYRSALTAVAQTETT